MSGMITRRGAILGAVASATALTLAATTRAADQPAVHEIRIRSFRFEPGHIQVRVGDVIRWTNEDLAPHTATAHGFGWETEEMTQDGSADIVVSEHMETGYFCAFHPHMQGSFEIL